MSSVPAAAKKASSAGAARRETGSRAATGRSDRSSDNIVRLFEVLPSFERPGVVEDEPEEGRREEARPPAVGNPAQPAAPENGLLRRRPLVLVFGIILGVAIATAARWVTVEVDRRDAWLTIAIVKPEPEKPKPDEVASGVLLGCIQGATKGALTAALPAAELATTGVLSSVSAIVVATATGLGCAIGAAGNTAESGALWAFEHAPRFVQRWFGWETGGAAG